MSSTSSMLSVARDRPVDPLGAVDDSISAAGKLVDQLKIGLREI